jgi:two-component system, cell cycle response regulator DivK
VSPSTPHGNDEPLVLVVDDDDRSLRLTRDVLRADGIRTIEATSGAEAVESAAKALPDVILLDLQLPDMDGIQVVRELRARDSTSQIPVVALTAMRTEGDADWLLHAGFAGCLEKPITVRDFPTQVRAHWSNAAS